MLALNSSGLTILMQSKKILPQMKSEFYFSPHCRLHFTIIIKRNRYKQSAHGIYVLPVATVHKKKSEKWENIAEPEWILASQNREKQWSLTTNASGR